MDRKTWYIPPDEEVILPEDLKKDPDKYGGLGFHMICAIQDGVITIPLCDTPNSSTGSCVSMQTCDPDAAKRIVKEGCVDILSKGYWMCINDTVPVFHGTEDPVPVWGQTAGDSLKRAGMLK